MIKILKGVGYGGFAIIMFILELVMSTLLIAYTPVYFIIWFFKICYSRNNLLDAVADYVYIWYNIWGWILM